MKYIRLYQTTAQQTADAASNVEGGRPQSSTDEKTDGTLKKEDSQ